MNFSTTSIWTKLAIVALIYGIYVPRVSISQAQLSIECRGALSNFNSVDPSKCLAQLPDLPPTEQTALVDDYLINGRTYIPLSDISGLIKILPSTQADRLNAVLLTKKAALRTEGAALANEEAIARAISNSDHISLAYLHFAQSEVARMARNIEAQKIDLTRAMTLAEVGRVHGLKPRINRRLADINAVNQQFEAAVLEYSDALNGFRVSGDYYEASEACKMLGYARAQDSSFSDSKLVELALERSEIGAPLRPCNAFASLHRAHSERDDTPTVREFAANALQLAEAENYETIRPSVLNTLAINAKRNGDYAMAAQFYQQATEAFDDIGNETMVAGVSVNLGHILIDLGETDDAIKTFTSALAVMERNSPDRLATILKTQHQIGMAHAKAGRHEVAIEWFQKAMDTSTAHTVRYYDGMIGAQYAKSLFATGQEDVGIETALSSANGMLEFGDSPDAPEAAAAYIWAANKFLNGGEIDKAQDVFARAEAIMRPEGTPISSLIDSSGDLYTRLEYARGMSDMLFSLGRESEAAPYARVALELSEARLESEKVRAVANVELQLAMREQEVVVANLSRDAVIASLRSKQERQRSFFSMVVAAMACAGALSLWWALRSQKRLADTRALFLSEIHHRTKNNLQVLSSLFNMDARRQKKIGASSAIRTDAANRARTMALIHDHMYRDDRGTDVALQPFVEDLLALMVESLGNGSVRLKSEIGAGAVAADDVTPIGLLICELVTNAYKHAFNAKDGGTINVMLGETPDGLELVVKDDGGGFEADAEPTQSDSMGLGLIEDLAEQLGGTVHVMSGTTGTVWTLSGLITRNVGITS